MYMYDPGVAAIGFGIACALLAAVGSLGALCALAVACEYAEAWRREREFNRPRGRSADDE